MVRLDSSRVWMRLADVLGSALVTIDYRKQAPLHEHLAKQYGENKFDIVVDMVGAQELYINSLVFLKEGCVYVNIGDYTNGLWTTLLNWFLNTYWPELLGGTPRKFIMFGPWGATKLVDQLTTLMADGKIKPVIEKSVSFDQVLEVSEMKQVFYDC